MMGKKQDSLSSEQLNEILENKKHIIPLNENHYKVILENYSCKDILKIFLYLDESKTKKYLGKKANYDILYYALKNDKHKMLISEIIIKYRKYDLNNYDSFEDLIVKLCELNQYGILKLIFEIVFAHPEYGITHSSINFKQIVNKFSTTYYYDNHDIELIRVLVEAMFQVNFENNDFKNMNLSVLEKFRGRFLTLALHMVMKTENVDFLKIFYPKLLSIAPNFSIDSFDINFKYPIITAFYDNGKIFKYIFELGANCEINRNFNSLFFFIFAVDTNRYLQAQCIIRKQIVINEEDISDTPLMKA
eukprot:jgi/Orpsp1_1/1188218/evm.model.d7180000063285.1